MVPALFQGVIGLVAIAFLIAIGIYWLLFPWFVYNKLNRLIQLMGENTAAINKQTAEIQATIAARSASSKAQPPAVAESPGYFVQTGSDTSGPFQLDKIRELRRRGVIDEGTLIASEGSSEWKKPAELGIE